MAITGGHATPLPAAWQLSRRALSEVRWRLGSPHSQLMNLTPAATGFTGGSGNVVVFRLQPPRGMLHTDRLALYVDF